MVMNISQQRTTSVGPRWVPGSKGVPQSLSVIPDCRNLWELKSLTDLAELCPRERIFSLTLLFHEFHYRNTSIPTTVPNMSFQRVWGGVSQNVLGSNHPSPPIVSWSTTDEGLWLWVCPPPSFFWTTSKDWGGDVVSVSISVVPEKQILVSFPQVYRKQKVYLTNAASWY